MDIIDIYSLIHNKAIEKKCLSVSLHSKEYYVSNNYDQDACFITAI